MRKIFIIMAIGAIGVGATSCKAWRTITIYQKVMNTHQSFLLLHLQ